MKLQEKKCVIEFDTEGMTQLFSLNLQWKYGICTSLIQAK